MFHQERINQEEELGSRKQGLPHRAKGVPGMTRKGNYLGTSPGGQLRFRGFHKARVFKLVDYLLAFIVHLSEFKDTSVETFFLMKK